MSLSLSLNIRGRLPASRLVSQISLLFRTIRSKTKKPAVTCREAGLHPKFTTVTFADYQWRNLHAPQH